MRESFFTFSTSIGLGNSSSEREWQSGKNGEKAGFLHGPEGGGGEGAVAGAVEGEEPREEWVPHVEPAAAEEGRPSGAAGAVDLEIREPEAGGGPVAAQGGPRRNGRRRFEDGGEVGPVDEGPAL